MAPNKKRKKATANPARGFATTSQPSKAKAAEPENNAQFESVSTTTPATNLPSNGIRTPDSGKEGHQPSAIIFQDMSADEVENYLEDAALQNLLDRQGSKCRLESNRHVIKLQNEQRQSRTQLHPIYMDDWLTEDVLKWSLKSYGPSVSSGTPTTFDSSKDERLILDLWVLQRVLEALKFPDVEKAIAHVAKLSIKQHIKSNISTAHGFSEALDWYAFNFEQKDLPSYGEQPAQNVTATATCKYQSTGTTSPKPEKTLNKLATSEIERALPSDAESDVIDTGDESEDEDNDDPSRLTDRWLALQTRLWGQTDQAPRNASAAKVTRLRKLQISIERIERDILFDKDVAESQWLLTKIQLQRRSALQRAATKVTNGDQGSGVTTPSIAKEGPRAAGEATVGSQNTDEPEDTDVFGSIFDNANDESAVDESTNGIDIHDFGRYTGLSPQSLLKQVCQTIDAKASVKISAIHQTSHSVRHRLECWWHDLHTPSKHAIDALPRGITTTVEHFRWRIEMVAVATSTAGSSADYISAVTLAMIFSLPGQDFKPAKRLPSVWSNLLTDISNEQKRLSDADDKAILAKLTGLVGEAKSSPLGGLDQHEAEPKGTFFPQRTRKDNIRAPRSSMSPDAATDIWNSRAKRASFQSMLKFRTQLPIYRHKEKILQAIAENPVVIICAETGSGKSTQAGTYILEQQLSSGQDCSILVTQPRRISAISLARRISQEIGENRSDLGTIRSLVGYAIRLESKTSETTRLTFATTGVLLRMLESTPTLDHLDYLILDEVHERTMEMDLAFIALQRLQQVRPSLKIILMSATVNATQFSRYFGNAPVLDIEGRTFPVTIKYLEDAIEATNDIAASGAPAGVEAEEEVDSDDRDVEKSAEQNALQGYAPATLRRLTELDEYKINYDLVVKLATAIATKKSFVMYSRAILIFMPGIAEIRRLNNALLANPTFAHKWEIHMLHSSFSTEELERAFTVPSHGFRKIVIATNIAETGITIPDVTAVIDTCKEKIMRFDERRQLSRLTEGFTARSSAKQRRGRAARVQAGLCFHLVTKHRHDNLFLEQQVPEMLRLSLQDSIMRIKVWDADASIEQTLAAAIDPPSKKNVNRAIERLKEAGALDNTEHLTALGERVARLPLDVSLAKMAILGTIFGCLEPVLAIISLMTSKSIFGSAGPGKAVFLRGASDLLSALAAYEAWRRASAVGQGVEFARKNHLINLMDIEDTKIQLLVYLVDGSLITLDSEEKRVLNNARVSSTRRGFYSLPERYNVAVNDDLLLSLIATSFYPRCLVREGKGYRNIFSNQQVSTARGSVIREMPKPPKWLSFSEAMRTKAGNAINIQEASRIPDMALSLFLGSDIDFSLFSGIINIDGRIRLKAPEWKQLLAIKLLRKQLRSLLESRYRSPNQSNARDDQLIELLRRAGHA